MKEEMVEWKVQVKSTFSVFLFVADTMYLGAGKFRAYHKVVAEKP
jgi:hypothetical protein